MRNAVVILPSFNEAENIAPLIKKIEEINKKLVNWDINILVVDSYSTDNTGNVVKDLQKTIPTLHIIEVPKEGLGKAYLRGFNYAINKFNPYLIIQMDADYQHDPERLTEFFEQIQKGADFVVGTRYSKGGSIPKNWAIHRKILSIGANLFIRLGFMKLKTSEWTNGYRAIKTWVIKGAFDHIKNYSGYVFQVAMIDYALKNNAKMSEIPVNFKERKFGISKINASQYVFQIIQYVLTHSSFIKFVIVGLIGFGVDFGISYLGIQKFHQAVWLITLLSTETAIVSNFILNKTGNYLMSFLKFNLVSSGSIAIQTIGMQILVGVFGRDLWYLYKILIIAFVIIPYSYILYNKFIWKNK
ncbi:MAG: Glycosyltransferase [Candidatus Roizmanbacteria bacterium GW2011_GWC2_37_13]|uniref:Glycosyltransferase n=1 Tax=Candidatus Roizmanbacteria bacterium GW2011_GWC2_37_13 TaxID=1618486 RepID=A0A0G0J8B9_9BACT|nr:MAG: Glycosyltransferase [Candidatus Roizmanbacteria bacterium GW2011_GWC2_37_13]